MDLNLVVLFGRLTMAPEVGMVGSSRSRFLRFLLAVRSEVPHSRLDVVPVVWWDPDEVTVKSPPVVGQRMAIIGSVQRRFWESGDGSHSRIEVVASHVTTCVNEPNETAFIPAPNGA